VRKDSGNLEGPRYAAAGDVRRRFPGNILAVIENRTRSRLQELGEQIEEGRFAGAVWADQRVDFSASHAQRYAVHRDETLELLHQSPRLENDVLRDCHRAWSHQTVPGRTLFRSEGCSSGTSGTAQSRDMPAQFSDFTRLP